MLQYASATGLIRTLLIILLVYYGIKIVTRIFGPALIKYVAKKTSERFGGQFDNYQGRQKEAPKRDGEVTIDKMPNTKTSNKDVGEYVDYEEID